MPYLYTLGIYLMGAIYGLAAAFVPKARQWISGRKQWRPRLRSALADWPAEQPRIWIHCASLGEFEQGRPLIEQLKKEQPQTRLLLTFFSPSGYVIRKDYPNADYVMYLPLDRPANARDFLDMVQPSLGIFVKYEFWFNYIAYAKKQSIPLVLIAGVFRPEQYFFQWYGGWFRRQLASFAHFYTQNEDSAKVLRQMGISQVTCAGDPRVDRVLQITGQARPFPAIEQWQSERPTLIVGSSWPPDEDLLFSFFVEALPADWCIILAPHDISARHLRQIEQRLDLSYEKYSDWQGKKPGVSQVLIIDNIGMLSTLYRYARIAYIGGGFGVGIHNILEPMAFGLPVLFGPKYEQFAEARAMVAEGGAFVIENAEDLKEAFTQLQEPAQYRKSQAAVQAYLQHSQNATTKILRSLLEREFLAE